jgi:hypothetical protein
MPVAKKNQKHSVNSKQEKKEASKREIVYKKVDCVIHHGENPITVAKAKALLGWQEETKKGEFGSNFIVKCGEVKVRCTNNETNRPLYMSVVETLKQEILKGRWRFNGEPIIIGQTGLMLNGQHTCIALVLAAWEFEQNPDKWPAWIKEPTIDKLIVYGVFEDDQTVNTMDTCKPRSLADVIYRAHYFKGMPSKGQRTLSRMLQFAINQMWEKTGVHANPHAVRSTHSESIAFLDTHPKLLAAVKHIFEEDNNEDKVGRYLSCGYSAAALYLMGCCGSKAESYYTDEQPNETLLDWSYWDRACEFFVELAGKGKTLKAVHDAIAALVESGAGSKKERWAIIAKAWEAYKDKKTVSSKTVHLEFVVKDEARHLTEAPLFGGIDVGEEGIPFNDPTEAEFEDRKDAVNEKRTGKKKQVAHRAGEAWAKGDTAWVHNAFEETTFVTLSGDPYECVDKTTKVLVDAPDGNWEVDVTDLSLAQFEMK